MDATITLKCNNNCIFCPRKDYLSIIASHSLRSVYADIINTRERSEKITLSGGEITVMDEIWDILAFCRQKRFKNIGIISNGRKLKSKKFTKALIEAGVNDFAISIYSLTAAVHDHITRKPGSCKETKRAVRNLLELCGEYDISLRVNLVLNVWNAEDILKTIKGLASWGVRQFIVAEQIIIHRETKHLSLKAIKDFLMKVKGLEFRDTYLYLRGFAPCLIGKNDRVVGSSIILKDSVPRIVLEPYEVGTLVKERTKKERYMRKFKNAFGKIAVCKDCLLVSTCPGIQKAYM